MERLWIYDYCLKILHVDRSICFHDFRLSHFDCSTGRPWVSGEMRSLSVDSVLLFIAIPLRWKLLLSFFCPTLLSLSSKFFLPHTPISSRFISLISCLRIVLPLCHTCQYSSYRWTQVKQSQAKNPRISRGVRFFRCQILNSFRSVYLFNSISKKKAIMAWPTSSQPWSPWIYRVYLRWPSKYKRG